MLLLPHQKITLPVCFRSEIQILDTTLLFPTNLISFAELPMLLTVASIPENVAVATPKNHAAGLFRPIGFAQQNLFPISHALGAGLHLQAVLDCKFHTRQ